MTAFIDRTKFMHEDSKNDSSRITYHAMLERKRYDQAARLYDQAFGKKFAAAIKHRDDRLVVLEGGFCGAYAFTACDEETLVGIAGYHSATGSLTGQITASGLINHLGIIKGLRAIAVFSFFERRPKAHELVMDGICVREDYRGLGVGSQLLRRIEHYAAAAQYRSVRLDVVDTNPAAKRLYERMGFVATRHQSFPRLEKFLGFGGATTMELKIDAL